ncbi:MAG: NAD-dependent epimerase/dehydratase family protein [Bacteroidota bacterium]
MKILITGANGFLGSHIVEESLKNSKNEVYAAIRESADTSYLDGLGSEILKVDYTDIHSLTNSLKEISSQKKLDLIIHNAGLTKSNSQKENWSVNKGITKTLLDAIEASKCLSPKGKLVYISSLAALGPVGTDGPVSSYGKSKMEAELLIKSSGIPFLIFRPTAIYGPRDKSFLSLFKTTKLGLYPVITPESQKITMIYAPDVARVILYYSNTESNRTINLTDGSVYSHQDFRGILESILGRKIRMFNVPEFLVKSGLFLIEYATKPARIKPVLTIEKFNEIKQDWNHPPVELIKTNNQLSLTSLKDGFAKTYLYYQNQNLL